MPIIQLVVSNLVNGSQKCIVNYCGRYNIQVLNIQYHDNSGQASRIIQFQSPELTIPNSSTPYITAITNAHININYDSGFKYHFENVQINNSITITPINTATGTTPTGFSGCILTLNLEKCE